MSSTAYLPGKHQGGRQWVKVFAVWLALIVAFLGVYNLFATPEYRGHGPKGAAALSDPHAFGSVGWVPLLVVLLLAGWIVWIRRRTRAFNVANLEALKLLAHADFSGAASQFDALAKAFRRPRNLQTVALFNHAMAVLRGGDLADAQQRLEAVDRRLASKRLGAGPLVAIELATIHALRGESELSIQWEAEAQGRSARAGDPRIAAGRLTLARAIRTARQGAYADAVQLLETEWRELESNLAGDALRPLRVVRAFVIAESRGAREAGNAEAHLAALHPSRPGEFAALGAVWPEMGVFLATHGL